MKLYQTGTKNNHADKIKQRQGLYGELILMPAPQSAIYMLMTGISEELLFRYGLLSIAAATMITIGFGSCIAFLIATALSSILFSLAHFGSYQKPSEFITLFFTGAILGLAFVATGNIIVPILAHAIYDFAIIATTRRKMRKNQHVFFGGLKPTALASNAKSGRSPFTVV